jgi:hypothetical protein
VGSFFLIPVLQLHPHTNKPHNQFTSFLVKSSYTSALSNSFQIVKKKKNYHLAVFGGSSVYLIIQITKPTLCILKAVSPLCITALRSINNISLKTRSPIFNIYIYIYKKIFIKLNQEKVAI